MGITVYIAFDISFLQQWRGSENTFYVFDL